MEAKLSKKRIVDKWRARFVQDRSLSFVGEERKAIGRGGGGREWICYADPGTGTDRHRYRYGTSEYMHKGADITDGGFTDPSRTPAPQPHGSRLRKTMLNLNCKHCLVVIV